MEHFLQKLHKTVDFLHSWRRELVFCEFLRGLDVVVPALKEGHGLQTNRKYIASARLIGVQNDLVVLVVLEEELKPSLWCVTAQYVLNDESCQCCYLKWFNFELSRKFVLQLKTLIDLYQI